MSSHRRTWQQHHVGHALVTIELEPAAADMSIEHHRRLGEWTKKLVDVLTAERLPATWAVRDPSRSPACSPIIRAGVEHEIAILGDEDWLGPKAGRPQFARELAQRVAQARTAGLNVTSLVTRIAPVRDHIDLVVKHGISAVAGVEQIGRNQLPQTTPRALHFGVWELPASERMPVARSWWQMGHGALLRRIRAAAQEAATFHLLIDAPALEESAKGSVNTLARVARRIAELRDRGLLQIETLRVAASRLAAVPAVKPQRSILSRAA